jgi:hypothetical protein
VDRNVSATFTDITFNRTCSEKKPTPVNHSSWGRVKVLYR